MPTPLLSQTAEKFQQYLSHRGLVFDAHIQADLLSAVFSSQLVLFAGPSGTGKSTAASALATFFAPPNRRSVIKVERLWESPSDVVGSYSTFANRFVPRPGLEQLRRAIAEPAPQAPSPFVIIEEANLSAMEGYLNPIMHELSEPAVERVAWQLHSMDGPQTVMGNDSLTVEPILYLGPWPRFLGTINVDHTAPAPAHKVCGRACVVLLEPPEDSASSEGVDALWSDPFPDEDESAPPGVLHDPRTTLGMLRDGEGLASLSTSLDGVLQDLRDAIHGGNPVGKRDEHRCLLFMAWFAEIAPAVPGIDIPGGSVLRVAAENAVLHFVLPGLSADQFSSAVTQFSSAGSGSLLNRRCKNLADHEEVGSFGVPVDFWESLT